MMLGLKKYSEYLTDSSKLLSLPEMKRRHILPMLICLSKYLGLYEDYKKQLKSYGIKWSNGDTSFRGFMSIFSKQHNTLPEYFIKIKPHLTASEFVFVKFLAVTGLRVSEAIESFNMIIDFYNERKLEEYYDESKQVLEHYKYPKFLRVTKNAYISFVSPSLIDKICFCDKVSYWALHCKLKRKRIELKFKQVRSYNNSYIRKNDIILELTDILAGRVPKSVFVRHYLGEDMEQLGKRVIGIQKKLDEELFGQIEA